MSAIDFQNGFIVGMATRGLTKGVPAIKITTARNGYNGSLSTWVLVTLNVELGAISSTENIEAFRIIGYKDWILKIFTVYEVLRISSDTLAIRTDNFDEVDLLLEIYYMQENGTLKTALGFPVTDFAGTFYIQFKNPKIKIRHIVQPVDISTVSSHSMAATVALVSDVKSSGTENVQFSDIGAVGSVLITHAISVFE